MPSGCRVSRHTCRSDILVPPDMILAIIPINVCTSAVSRWEIGNEANITRRCGELPLRWLLGRSTALGAEGSWDG